MKQWTTEGLGSLLSVSHHHHHQKKKYWWFLKLPAVLAKPVPMADDNETTTTSFSISNELLVIPVDYPSWHSFSRPFGLYLSLLERSLMEHFFPSFTSPSIAIQAEYTSAATTVREATPLILAVSHVLPKLLHSSMVS
mmetsp:Transcript_18064/g.44634  ORF Transcript_18064/g.44634 Transcript_18064/m.44634 type:complete len:138 (+) Transcript_18064:3882-4295(+)